MLPSPYHDQPRERWQNITESLVAKFPLPMPLLASVVETAWADLHTSSFGKSNLRIGTDIFLPAQATGVILERLIAVHLHMKFPEWRGGNRKTEKDVVCDARPNFSFEIKTSSSASGLFGNRSTGYRSEGRTKFRTGYYLVINYKLSTEADRSHALTKLRFGWIDDDDWVGQAQPSGQQASIGSELARLRLITIR